jgi:hypothetical protein
MKEYKEELDKLLAGMWGYKNSKGCFLAGGAITSAITNTPVRDFDLYFKSKEDFVECLEAMYDDGFWCVAITPRAVTFSDNGTIFQLMCFNWFKDAEEIFAKFDFTINMAAIDLEGGKFIKHDDFVRDISARTLRFNHRTEFPLGSMMRVRKYLGRGYTIEDSEYLKIVIACAMKNITSWDELKRQIGGQYGEAMRLDTSTDFTLDNAIAALNTALEREKKEGSLFQDAPTAEAALAMIFGPEKAAA